MDDYEVTLSDAVLYLLRDKNQVELAEELGMPQSLISRVLGGSGCRWAAGVAIMAEYRRAVARDKARSENNG